MGEEKNAFRWDWKILSRLLTITIIMWIRRG